MTLDLYGISNCDTVKKARRWLDEAGVGHVFHDFRKEGVNPARLATWADVVGWETLLNRAGTTFRGLSDADRADIDRAKALALMIGHPALIKRPVVEGGGGLVVGFKPERYAEAFA